MKLLLLTGLIALAAPARADDETCLLCHGKPSDISLQSGELYGLGVDKEAFARSSHGKKLNCVDCHTDLKDTSGAHPAKRLASKREFAIRYSEACQKCHFANYTDTQDGVHRARIKKGNLEAAVCSDCHGAHDVSSPSEPRTKISQTCSRCHPAIAAAWTRSVHGRAAAAPSSADDVPTCTDCHHAHDIADPKAGSWLVRTPDMCAKCHADEKLMAKYNLSTQVSQTYVSDFHGVTAKLQEGEKDPRPVVALCTDCHGVHDIVKVNDANSPVIKANLLATCQKCHKDAKADFPSSWLSHYEPSLQKAPLVYLVKLLYKVLIPFMIGGLALQILLHLWRIVVNR